MADLLLSLVFQQISHVVLYTQACVASVLTAVRRLRSPLLICIFLKLGICRLLTSLLFEALRDEKHCKLSGCRMIYREMECSLRHTQLCHFWVGCSAQTRHVYLFL